MTDLEKAEQLAKVEELTKALQEGKTLINNKNFNTMKLINGVLCRFYKNNASPDINSYINNPKEWQIQEPEPEFEITPNQLAEYECRDGSKAVCYGVDNSGYTVAYENGMICAGFYGNGRESADEEKPYDLIRKIRDL